MIAIIAEKPSVGLDIARVVGADKRNDGYCSGNGYMVTWALGHLVSLAMPDVYGYTKTTAEELPMLPVPFRLVSRQIRTDRGMVTDIAATKQLKVIDSVFSKCDSIIVATDAGREGELIFRWIYAFLECTKPFRRLWISSLTDEAIRKGLEELKEGTEYDSLYAAADSRAKADWLVGMNASRALAIVSSSSNNSIGRVQTPTLAMICSRYKENRSFVSTPYWQLHVTLKNGDSHRRFFHTANFSDRQEAETAYRRIFRFPCGGHEGGTQENPATAAAALRPDGTPEGLQRASRPARGKDAGHRPVALREETHFLPENGKPLHPARRDGLRARTAGKNPGHAGIRRLRRNPRPCTSQHPQRGRQESDGPPCPDYDRHRSRRAF